MNDEKSSAAAHRAGTVEKKRPSHLNLTKDQPATVDFRRTALAAGAIGLGYLAFRTAKALLPGRRPSAKVTPEPLLASTGPDVKDNAAPRFSAGQADTGPVTPFVAASDADDTGDLIIDAEPARTAASPDRSAETPEHVPTDLMGDRQPGGADRAIDAFRPDPTAPVPDAMRESLRPATGPATGFAANRGDFASGLSQKDGPK